MFDWQNRLVEIRFPNNTDNFLTVKETLTRIGAPAFDTEDETQKVLWQSCHILYKRQKYFILGFKELFLLDGKERQTTITENDLARRNAIALLLEQWGLIEIVDHSKVETPPPVSPNMLTIIAFRDKKNWSLRAKYDIGKTSRYINKNTPNARKCSYDSQENSF